MDALITLAMGSGAPDAAGAVCMLFVRTFVLIRFAHFSLQSSRGRCPRIPDQKDCQDRAERYLAFVREIARSSGVPCESAHVVNDHPYEGIIDAARTKGCDLIFMASHGRKGVAALVLGSETTKVLTHSKIPTLVCR